MMLRITLFLGAILLVVNTSTVEADDVEDMKDAMLEMEDKLDEMKNQFYQLARQVMLQQFNSEMRVRTGSQSGVKTIRGTTAGPRNYQTTSHMHNRFLAIHDHADHMSTVGLGELNAVINGVEFITRHNDYLLVMPDGDSDEYHATRDIPMPEVPPSVLALDSIEEQSKEMAEYFRAFNTQNKTHRDYEKYFQPILCYMEGAWTLDEEIVEPFESDRHQLEASSWMELQDLIRYNAYTGMKNVDENYAWLPTKIMDFDDNDNPIYAQWNYRLLCNPITVEEIKLSYLVQVWDLKYAYYKNEIFTNTRGNRNARFVLDEDEGKLNSDRRGIIDRIMYTIPGMDNRPKKTQIEGYMNTLYVPETDKTVLQDTSMYSRSTEGGLKDAMGGSFLIRGWNEQNMWTALNTQERIAPIALDTCLESDEPGCKKYYTRMSWAFPVEIIYLTPLWNWNPYDIPLRKNKDDVRYSGRNGDTAEKALDGNYKQDFYRTPAEFFDGSVPFDDDADTAKDFIWVLDGNGVARNVSATGQRIATQHIRDGVGFVRLRYPIAPISDEGNGGWMESNALKDWVIEMALTDMDKESFIRFNTSVSEKEPPALHLHLILISVYDVKMMLDKAGRARTVTTEVSEGHFHKLDIKFEDKAFRYFKCYDDPDKYDCVDKHGRLLYPWPEDIADKEYFPKVFY